MAVKKAIKSARSVRSTTEERNNAMLAQAMGAKTNARVRAGSLALSEARAQYGPQTTYEKDTLEWVRPADLVDIAFKIHRIFRFKTKNGQMIGLEICRVGESEHYLVMLSMKGRERLFEALRGALRKAETVGPCTIEAVPTDYSNPFYAVIDA